jgi:hypothetical protein
MLMLLIGHENVSDNISKVIHATLEYNPCNIKIEPQHNFLLTIHELISGYIRI